MAINFAAEHMQGYNNPDIEIVNVEIDNDNILSDITYNDVEKILARGVFPIVSMRGVEQGITYIYILPLAAAGGNKIIFAAVTLVGSSCMYVGIEFTPETRNIIHIPIKK